MTMLDQKIRPTVPFPVTAFEKSDRTALCWLGSAGFVLNIHGYILFIDPVLSPSAKDPAVCSDTGLPLKREFPITAGSVPRADCLLYTHADRDHMGSNTVLTLSKLQPRIFCPLFAGLRLTKYGVNPDLIHFCRAGDLLKLETFVCVEVIHADHPWQLKDMDRFGPPYTEQDCVGFIVHTPEGRLLFPGDSRLTKEHGSLGDLTLIALDVSEDAYHMGRASSVWLANHYATAKLVPCHYDTYAVDEPGYNSSADGLLSCITHGDTRIKQLIPGEILDL